jgi:hypothetical protein
MAKEFGIFSEAAGGCIYHPFYSIGEAEDMRAEAIRGGEDSADLAIKVLCPEHEEQPLEDCQDCAEDEQKAPAHFLF